MRTPCEAFLNYDQLRGIRIVGLAWNLQVLVRQ